MAGLGNEHSCPPHCSFSYTRGLSPDILNLKGQLSRTWQPQLVGASERVCILCQSICPQGRPQGRSGLCISAQNRFQRCIWLQHQKCFLLTPPRCPFPQGSELVLPARNVLPSSSNWTLSQEGNGPVLFTVDSQDPTRC